MKWLPSFVKLFLLFVLGVLLQFGGTVGLFSSFGNYTVASLFEIVRLLGLLLMFISPILILLKLFARLDKQSS